jgi:hypothetical protein
MTKLSANNEERELMRGIEQVLRDMVVPELKAIKKQFATLSATVGRMEDDLYEYRSRHRAA